jgi:DNA end-binding protein Ku
MASTVWKGQLTFGLVSFPVRLLRAARKERVPLRYIREEKHPSTREIEDSEDLPSEPSEPGFAPQSPDMPFRAGAREPDSEPEIASVRQAYFTDAQEEPISARDLQRGYEVAPEKYVVVRNDELRKLRVSTSPEMQILRSVRMQEIDPVFLETSYYVIPDAGGEHSYGLFYRALLETQYAALAQVAMHGREHIMIIRAAKKGLIAHTMYYINEVRESQEFAADLADVEGKELSLAKRFVEAIAEPFRPEEFTDRYREQLEALIASKDAAHQTLSPAAAGQKNFTKVIDIMDALRKSLEKAEANKTTTPSRRKPTSAGAPLEIKTRKAKA